MMGFLSSIKAYIAGAVVLLIGILGATARHFYKKARKEEKESDRLRRRAEEQKKRRELERNVHNAQQEARKKARENAEAEKKRIDNDVRPDSWGDDRLRDKD